MTANPTLVKWLLPMLFAVCANPALSAPDRLRIDGIYRSEVQTNADGVDYLSLLRFAPDGRVFLTHVSMPARQEKVCEWFRPELAAPHWGSGAGYRLDAQRLIFRTESLNATTLFDGMVDADVLKMQLTVPTKQDLSYPLLFRFAPCP
ncbi:hypothetical protein [Hydrogenophaga sp.]|uniref:hypothetical protein n=1 Tax=Hydrogenophaga sp. TaxID=1904254 RepID=UPI0035AF78B4